jgi:tetratricopeptide (TPR) repeat protein
VTQPVGTLETALRHTARLLESTPALAVEQALEILKAAPGHPAATLLLGKALSATGEHARALATLERLVHEQANWALAHYQYGLEVAAHGRGDDAVTALRRAVQLKPDLAEAWRALGDHLAASGDESAAEAAAANAIRASTRDPRLLGPAAALCENRVADAEASLRAHLRQHPRDAAALRMLAEVAVRRGRYAEAEELLGECLGIAPSFTAARRDQAHVLHRQGRTSEALPVIEQLLAADPNNPGLLATKAAYLTQLGDVGQSIALYEDVLRQYPKQARLHISHGNALKTAGRRAASIEAYRRCIELAPQTGEAWWSLANLKRFRFSEADVAAMRAQCARTDLADEDRVHFEFALGKALEDQHDYAGAFEHYARGNSLARPAGSYDADETTRQVERAIGFFTAERLHRQSGMGAGSHDPIFIVGLPRAGSTLIEQILSSHSHVEGTAELPEVMRIARKLGGGAHRGTDSPYPAVLATLSANELRDLGEQYLARTRCQRRTPAPRFIDKMPNNWLHVGLIHLMLPNARIVDARRHPLSCCFSNFKQHFARGQDFTYDLADLARYYRDYVALMDHFDAVLPGRVHRVHYERMVDDTEQEVRRLLDYCGLPFEPSCLRFYETERAVRTPSSEQVRSPIYRDSVDQWQHFEPWLGPLAAALGPALAGRRTPHVS